MRRLGAWDATEAEVPPSQGQERLSYAALSFESRCHP